MIKKYLLDILCLIVVVIVAFLIVERPAIDLNLPPSIADKRQTHETTKEETKKGERGIARYASTAEALKERNIFSPNGSYAMSGAVFKGPLPENPYTLIGVLKGEEKKAVFREYTGAIVTLSVGKKLIDGSVITRIDTTSVEVKKGKEKRKLKIFEVIVPKLSTVKKP
jgi:hypothetical protein